MLPLSSHNASSLLVHAGVRFSPKRARTNQPRASFSFDVVVFFLFGLEASLLLLSSTFLRFSGTMAAFAPSMPLLHDFVATNRPRSTRLTFEPAMNADEIIVNAFCAKDLVTPTFPELYRTVSQEKAKPYLQQQAERAKRPPVPVVPLVQPRFYPEIASAVLPSSVVVCRNSPRAFDRGQMTRKLVADLTIKDALPPNMKTVLAALVTRMGDDAKLTAVDFTRAVADLGVEDVVVADQLFQLLDIHREGSVRVSVAILLFSDIINGPDKLRVRQACFNLFNINGYIPRELLDELKFYHKFPPESQRTHQMVKVLKDVFERVLAQEEERYVNEKVAKGKGKKKKVPPLKPTQKSHVPITYMRIAHLDFAAFVSYFDSFGELACAFFPCWALMLAKDAHLQHMAVSRRIQHEEQVLQLMDKERDAAAAAGTVVLQPLV